MNETDAALLRRYTEGSEAAFTELVHRHVDLVYGAAVRRTGGDAHRAADVAQQVFTTLAREARKLSRHPVLGAWLHTATRNAALNLMISEQRRKSRENAAAALAPGTNEPNLNWESLRPVLDAAIDELPETDRAAVVLRFLDRRAFAEIGAALRVSEDAARMRIDRALDKLRAALGRRGITSTSAALGAIVSSQPVISAPTGLAAVLASESLATTAAAAGVFTTFTSLMSTTTFTAAAFSALVAFGAGAYFGFSRNFDAPPPPPLETPRHSEMIASLRQDNLSLKAEVGRLNADVNRMKTANAQLAVQRSSAAPAPNNTASPFWRGQLQKAVLNNLRQLAAAIDQFQLENKRPPTSLDELVGETKYIRRLVAVEGENYAGVSLRPNQALVVTTTSGERIIYDPSGNNTTVPETTPAMQRVKELGQRLEPAGKKAMDAYRAANNGTLPSNPEALLPYFATPQEGADFVEFLEAQKAASR